MLFLKLISYLFLVVLTLGCKTPEVVEVTKEWWETAQFYQIYPRSFMDSDGDGIGDINGIISKLDHLKDIGVTATWLSPIFKSPMADFGYDISDFYDIQNEYGTMEDFENLLAKAKELNIKVILDFVPNHSSNENIWFQKSVNRIKDYEDFYVWHDGHVDESTASGRRPPSNWLQSFRGSAWEWNEQRQQYYLHQFAVQQPDLNYRNPIVVERMKSVLRFWLRKGVDGFRVDAVPNLFEVAPDAYGNYPDEPLSGLTNDPDERIYLRNIHTENQPETIDMAYQWRQVLDDHQRIFGGDSRVLLIETYSPYNYTMLFYGNRTTDGAHLPFNFHLITEVNNVTTALELKTVISGWLNAMPLGHTANWVIGNHDRRRAGSRYGVGRIDAMNMLVMLLPGVSITYQGEEIGMLDGKISWEETVDPAACNSNSTIYEKFSRDPCRTPFQWTNGLNAGFSTAAKTWLPVAEEYQTLNVQVETAAARSYLNNYKSLTSLRNTRKSLRFGDYKYDAIENVFFLKRYHSSDNPIYFLTNFGNTTQTVNLKTIDSNVKASLKTIVVSLDSSISLGTTLDSSNINLQPNEALVLE